MIGKRLRRSGNITKGIIKLLEMCRGFTMKDKKYRAKGKEQNKRKI